MQNSEIINNRTRTGVQQQKDGVERNAKFILKAKVYK